MKGPAVLVFCLLLIANSQVDGEEEGDTIQMVERIMKTCKEQHKIQKSEIEDAIKNQRFPTGTKGKRFLLCIIKAVGFNQLKSIIKGSKRPNGGISTLIQLPDLERELDELSSYAAIT